MLHFGFVCLPAQLCGGDSEPERGEHDVRGGGNVVAGVVEHAGDPRLEGGGVGAALALGVVAVWRRLQLKAKFESSLSQFSFKS